MWDSSGNPLNSGHIDFYFQNEHLSEPGQSAEAAVCIPPSFLVFLRYNEMPGTNLQL